MQPRRHDNTKKKDRSSSGLRGFVVAFKRSTPPLQPVFVVSWLPLASVGMPYTCHDVHRGDRRATQRTSPGRALDIPRMTRPRLVHAVVLARSARLARYTVAQLVQGSRSGPYNGLIGIFCALSDLSVDRRLTACRTSTPPLPRAPGPGRRTMGRAGRLSSPGPPDRDRGRRGRAPR
jgi:hypothetical protein